MRFHSLDALRAAMMFLGVVLHSATAYANPPGIWWYKDAQRSHSMDLLVLFIHVFRLPVFFAMAGFFSALLVQKRGPTAFLQNRFQRILLPLLAGLLFIYPILRFLADALEGRPTPFTRLLRLVEPTHFWFLETLFLTCLLAIPLRPWLNRLPFPSSPYPYAILTCLALLPTEHGFLDTPHSFAPVWTVQIAYALFFAGGWALYNGRERLEELVPPANTRLALGLFFAAASSALVILKLIAGRDWRFGIAACGALSVWYLILGLTGFFLRHFSHEDPLLRYLADSAYWVYLTHPIGLLLMQAALRHLAWPAEVKFFLGFAIATPLLLVTYDLFVRSTPIGQFLNGSRWPSHLLAPKGKRI